MRLKENYQTYNHNLEMYVTVIRIINHHRAHWDKRNNNFPLAFTENEKDNLSVSQIIEKAMTSIGNSRV